MKLSHKLAGLFSSGVFVLDALPGLYQRVKPVSPQFMLADAIQGMDLLETLGISLLGALVAGGIGYYIGEILSKPKGSPGQSRLQKPAAWKNDKAPVAVTGNETFLDDVEPAAPSANALPVEDLAGTEPE